MSSIKLTFKCQNSIHMKTYRFRILFYVHQKGVIKCPVKRLLSKFSNGIEVMLLSFGAKYMNEGKQFVITGTGYKAKEEAMAFGEIIKDSILVAAAKLRIGVDVGKDTSYLNLNPVIAKKLFEKYGVTLISNVHGLSVYEDVEPIRTITSHPVSIFCPSEAEVFINSVRDFAFSSKKLSNKTRLALELYGASHYEKSDRARFLTQVLGVEALLAASPRSKEAQAMVSTFIDSVNDSQLIDKEKQSLIGSLNWLYNKSISHSLRELSSNHLANKTYNNVSAEKFITNCYSARSKLVHTGSVNHAKFNIGTLAAQLDVFFSDLLTAIIESDT